MTNPTSNFGWQMPTSTDLVTDLPADFEVFGQAVDTSLADLKGGTTGQVLSKATNADMDFTWVAQDDSNAIQNAIVDAKGDLITATAADTPARLAAGTNETRLVADSTQATGLKYVADTTNYAINAKGDLLAGTAADTLAALTVGTNGQVLTADSTVSPTGLKWATPSSTPTFVGCQVYKSTSQALTTSTWTTITFDTESFDTDNFHSTVTNTSRMTIPAGKAGYYRADLNAMGYNWTLWQYRLLLNGTAVSSTFVNNGMTNGTENMTFVFWNLNLAVGDYIEWQGWQNAGANRNINGNTQFNLSYLGV